MSDPESEKDSEQRWFDMEKRMTTQHLKHRPKRFLRKALALGMAFSFLPGYLPYIGSNVHTVYAEGALSTNTLNYDKTNIKDGTILHCFGWDYQTIMNHMDQIKKAGFTAIRTSPVNSIAGGIGMGKNFSADGLQFDGVWQYQNQPTDFYINHDVQNWQLGSYHDFFDMITKADTYGIQVIVDVTPNQTSKELALISPRLVSDVGGWDLLYHENAKVTIGNPLTSHSNPSEYTIDPTSRLDITSKNVSGLPDINTENPKFQAYFVKYMNKLIDIGVDGFYFTNAEHIALPGDAKDLKTQQMGWENNFWDVVTGRHSVNGVRLQHANSIFFYGDVSQTSAKSDAYSKYMYLTADDYATRVQKQLNTAYSLEDHTWPQNQSDLVNVELHNQALEHLGNHKNQLVTRVESEKDYMETGNSAHLDDLRLRFGWAAIAARADGTPIFFSRPQHSNGWEDRFGLNEIGLMGNEEFMDKEVQAVNLFRKEMIGQPQTFRSYENGQVFQIDRGTQGSVIINAGSMQKTIAYETTMAVGTYTDQAFGTTFEVVREGGKNILKGEIQTGKIAVIYHASGFMATNSIHKPYYYGDQTLVTLTATNTSNNRYVTSDGKHGNFKNGDQVMISPNADGKTFVTLFGVNGNDPSISHEQTFEFTKLPSYDVYAEMPDGLESISMVAYNGDPASGVEVRMEKIEGIPDAIYGTNIDPEVKAKVGNTRIGFSYTTTDGVLHRDPPYNHEYFTFDEALQTSYYYKKNNSNWIEGFYPVPKDEIPLPPLAIDSFEASSSYPVKGEVVEFTVKYRGEVPSDSYLYEFQVTENGAVTTRQVFGSDPSFTFQKEQAGLALITVGIKRNETDTHIVYKTVALEWAEERTPIAVTLERSKESPQKVGSPVVYTATATGGIGTYSFKFTKTEGSNTSSEPDSILSEDVELIQDFHANNRIMLDSSEAKTYTIMVEVKDESGHTAHMTDVFEWIGNSNAASPSNANQNDNGNSAGNNTTTGNSTSTGNNASTDESSSTGNNTSNGNSTSTDDSSSNQSNSNPSVGTGNSNAESSQQTQVNPTGNETNLLQQSSQESLPASQSEVHTSQVQQTQANANQTVGSQDIVNPAQTTQPPTTQSSITSGNTMAQSLKTRVSQKLTSSSRSGGGGGGGGGSSRSNSGGGGSVKKSSNKDNAIDPSAKLVAATKTNKWYQQNGRWFSVDNDGARPKNAWRQYEWQNKSDWYYFDANGFMLTGWQWIGKKCYYLDASGRLLVNTITPDGFYVNQNGEWIIQNQVQTR